MKRLLHVAGPLYKYKYLIEYNKSTAHKTTGHNIKWCNYNNCVRLFTEDTFYYRNCNDWYGVENINTQFEHNYIPENVYTTNINVYIPNFAAHIHTKGVKYVVTLNTWINDIKIDLGSYIFRPTDTMAISTGSVKSGNQEYFEYISFDIIDPYYLMYSDEWIDFRHNVCKEPKNVNDTPASLYVSFYVVNEYENRYIMNSDFVGSCNNFVVSDINDYLIVNLKPIQDPKLGFRFNVTMNPEYDWFPQYLQETYNLNLPLDDIRFNVVIKNKDSIVIGPTIPFSLPYENREFGQFNQDIYWDTPDMESFKLFFSSWNDFEEGWELIGSLTFYDVIKDDDGEIIESNEIYSILSNSTIVNQEIYSWFHNNGGSEKLNVNDLIIPNYNVVNKLEHVIKIVDRPMSSINDYKDLVDLPIRIKQPDKLSVHKVYTRPVIKQIN